MNKNEKSPGINDKDANKQNPITDPLSPTPQPITDEKKCKENSLDHEWKDGKCLTKNPPTTGPLGPIQLPFTDEKSCLENSKDNEWKDGHCYRKKATPPESNDKLNTEKSPTDPELTDKEKCKKEETDWQKGTKNDEDGDLEYRSVRYIWDAKEKVCIDKQAKDESSEEDSMEEEQIVEYPEKPVPSRARMITCPTRQPWLCMGSP
jgi:hypothetical protein